MDAEGTGARRGAREERRSQLQSLDARRREIGRAQAIVQERLVRTQVAGAVQPRIWRQAEALLRNPNMAPEWKAQVAAAVVSGDQGRIVTTTAVANFLLQRRQRELTQQRPVVAVAGAYEGGPEVRDAATAILKLPGAGRLAGKVVGQLEGTRRAPQQALELQPLPQPARPARAVDI